MRNHHKSIFFIKRGYGFTLVELIVVITILSILGTISLISLQGYSGQARDSNRIETLTMIDKGLALSNIKTGRYPFPEGTVSSGSINSVTLAYVGEIRDTIAYIASMNKAPQDPLSSNYYPYGADVNGQYYQTATVLENSMAYESPLTPAYADGGAQARVSGNYDCMMKVGTNLYNPPSIVFVGSGDLVSNGHFIVNKMNNLPYKLRDETDLTPKTTSELLNTLSSGKTSTLTGIVAPLTMDEFNANSGALATLGCPTPRIGKVALGDKYTDTATGVTTGTCEFGDGVTTGTVLEDCTL